MSLEGQRAEVKDRRCSGGSKVRQEGRVAEREGGEEERREISGREALEGGRGWTVRGLWVQC